MLAIMNPDDKAGLEAALRIKDETGAKVTVLTMGLPKADAVLREAMAMGACRKCSPPGLPPPPPPGAPRSPSPECSSPRWGGGRR